MKSKELLVGVFSAISLALLYFGFNYLKGIDFFSTTNNYYALYDNVNQLTVSNPVLVNGFAVGRVSGIRLLPQKQNKVLVELEIDSHVKLGHGAKATLYSDFLGSKSILLDLGKLDPRNMLKPKDTIDSEVAKGITDLLKTAEPVANSLESTILKLNNILDNLGQNSDEMNRIFTEFEKTPHVLNNTLRNADSKLNELTVSFKATAEKMNGTIAKVDPLLDNFKTFSDSLKVLQLNGALKKTQQTLTSLQEVLAKLKKGDNTASKLMTDDSLYVNLNKLLVHMDSLMVHINTNPRHFTAPLGKSRKKIEKEKSKEEEKKKSGTP